MTNKIIEVVIYTVAESAIKDFSSSQQSMIEQLKSYHGFVSGLTFKDSEKDRTFIDYIVWETQQDGQAAANEIKHDKACAAFINAIESIVHSGYYQSEEAEKRLNISDFNADTVLEFALGEIKPSAQASLGGVKAELFDLVRQQNGLIQVISAVDTAQSTRILDTLCWASKPQADAAMAVIHQTEQCQVFMETFAENVFFGHLHLYRATQG